MPTTEVLLSGVQAAQAAGVTRRQFIWLVDNHKLEPAARAKGKGGIHRFRRTQALAVRAIRPLLPLGIHPDLETIELLVKGTDQADGVWCDFTGRLFHVKAPSAPLPSYPMIWLPVRRPELRS